MTASVDHRSAAALVEDALGDVYDRDIVSRLREDSPLESLGMTPADAVCLADAIAGRAAHAGLTCQLSDDSFVAVRTVADLIREVEANASSGTGT